jgi:hypothetical protein
VLSFATTRALSVYLSLGALPRGLRLIAQDLLGAHRYLFRLLRIRSNHSVYLGFVFSYVITWRGIQLYVSTHFVEARDFRQCFDVLFYECIEP